LNFILYAAVYRQGEVSIGMGVSGAEPQLFALKIFAAY
jgi:hypothetical protein